MIRVFLAASVSVMLTAAISCLLLVNTASAADADEIKVFYAFGMHPALKDLLPAFEKASGHKVSAANGAAGAVADRVRSGEAADMAIVTRAQSEELEKQGRIVAGSRRDLAKVGVGIYVPKGAPKPDISSAEALKHSLQTATSIAYVDPAVGAASGIYVAGLIECLAVELAPKTRRYPGATIFPAVAQGEVELAFGQISEILDAPGVDLVGPLPAPIQNYTQFTAGIVAGSKQAAAGKALISFLSSPDATAVLKAKGFETP